MSLIEWVFPSRVTCMLCGREALTDARCLCADCAGRLSPPPEEPCPAALDGFAAGARFDAATAGAVHRMKYGDARYLAPFFASLIEVPADWRVDALTPVPLHKNKLRARGYNQSALIAYALAKRLGLPVEEELLVRARDTGSQTALDAALRTRNVAGAFLASPAAAGKRVLLVDDVRTTGATVCACAAALRAAGASGVYCVTALARGLEAGAAPRGRPDSRAAPTQISRPTHE
ncbi:MAG: DNA utilization protein GntX [Firmicutes bacterium ADurb.Bin248]|nr:MAG: DNA utilization protein GntX [Firmicutes bacterium ADurb.Bin248]HOG00940.1 phosphoribosyltransferase family protein [Clostridia bacterium]HPK15319.1 phosphoribosyltransferase family protein [Clostridia bacterium]